jgi:flagellar secretion chaperone FliS
VTVQTPAASYKESSILTAPPERLVVMLYDGARRFLTQGAGAMRERDIERANARLQKAEAVIEELLTTLDLSAGEVAERLQGLYVFCRRTLGEARIEQSPEKIEQVSEILAGLREAFAQIGSSEAESAGASAQ